MRDVDASFVRRVLFLLFQRYSVTRKRLYDLTVQSETEYVPTSYAGDQQQQIKVDGVCRERLEE